MVMVTMAPAVRHVGNFDDTEEVFQVRLGDPLVVRSGAIDLG